MKLSRLHSTLLAFVCFAGLAQADIVILKDGKRLEGNITAENPQAIHMRYKLTPKIWDDKDIPRSEIAEIIKQKPEEVELIELKKLFPTADLMPAEKYEQLIQDRLRPFVNRYPGTKEAAESEKLIEEAQAEKEKVVAGGIKMEGKWLNPDEAKAAQYNVKAYGLRAEMLEKEAAKDYTGALKAFDQLSGPVGMASTYYPKAIEEALAVLTKLDSQVEQMIKDQPTLQKMRDEGIKKLIEPDLSRMKNAIDREKEQWKTTYDLERKNSRWFTPYKYDLASLKSLSQAIAGEKSRLTGINLATITKTNEAIAQIMSTEAAAMKDPAALKKMGDAILAGEAAAGSTDTNTQQFYSTIFQGYRQRYAYAQQQIATQAQPTAGAPGAVGGSSAISGTATPGMDDRVAAALAAAAGGTAVAPAPGTATAVPAGTQAPGAVQAVPNPAAVAPVAGVPVQPGMVAPGTVPPQAGYVPQVQPGTVPPQAGYAPQVQPGAVQQQPYNAAPVAVPPQVAQEAPVPEEEGGLSTNTLLLIGVGVLVIVLVAAMSGGKKKK